MKTYIKYIFQFIILVLLFHTLKASANPDDKSGEFGNSSDNGGSREYDDYDKCLQTEPTKDIIEECTEGNKLKDKVCCYMTVKYEYNNFYTCYPIEKDKKKIEEAINEIKGEYGECKTIKINCKSSFTKYYQFFVLLLILI